MCSELVGHQSSEKTSEEFHLAFLSGSPRMCSICKWRWNCQGMAVVSIACWQNPKIIVGLATPSLSASFISPPSPLKKGSIEVIEEHKKKYYFHTVNTCHSFIFPKTESVKRYKKRFYKFMKTGSVTGYLGRLVMLGYVSSHLRIY